MWYVIQTVGGQEQAVRALIERRSSGDASNLVEQCFIPMRERTVKRGGEWKLVQEKLFPGYVFVVTEDAQKLLQNLKSLPRFTRLLGTGANEFVPLRPEEIAFLQRFEDSGHIARLSKVEVVEGGRIRILSGALLNCEGMITKVHLQKRVAEGLSLGEAIAQSGMFDSLTSCMIRTAGTAGCADTALASAAQTCEEDVENRMDKLVSMIEPTLVGVLSVVIGTVLLSVMLPMAGIISSIL